MTTTTFNPNEITNANYPVQQVTEILLNKGRTADEIEIYNGVLRVGYWDTLKITEIAALGKLIQSVGSDWDEDCGWMNWYNLAPINA